MVLTFSVLYTPPVTHHHSSRIRKPISSLISYIKPFISSPSTRGIRPVSIVWACESSYDVPRGRNESSLKHDNGSFHKRFHIKRPPLQRRLDSSVGIVMGLGVVRQRNRGSIASRGKTFISSCPDRMSAYPASYPVNNGCSFPRGKKAWAWSWPFTPFSAEVKKEYLHFPIHLHGAHSANLAFIFFPCRVQILGNILNILLENDSRLYSTELSRKKTLFYKKYTAKFVIDWLPPLPRNRKAPRSNLSTLTGYPDRG